MSFKYLKFFNFIAHASVGFLLGICSIAAQAQDQVQESIQFAVPYYMTSDSKNGVHFEILKQAFATQGVDIMPVYLPLADIYPALMDREVRGAYLEGFTEITYLYPSKVYSFRLAAVVVTLETTPGSIQSLNDLLKKRVIAFQNAGKLLGKEFFEFTRKNPNYSELSNQELQVRELYKKETDAIVIADSIFSYYRSLLPSSYASAPITIHRIFDEKNTGLVLPVFNREQDKVIFEKGIAALKGDKRFDQIITEWANNPDLD